MQVNKLKKPKKLASFFSKTFVFSSVLVAAAAGAGPLSPITALENYKTLYNLPNYQNYSIRIDTDGAALAGYVCSLTNPRILAAVELLDGGRVVASEMATRYADVANCLSKGNGFYINIPESSMGSSRLTLRFTDSASNQILITSVAVLPAKLAVTSLPRITEEFSLDKTTNMLTGNFCRNSSVPQLRLSAHNGLALSPTMGPTIIKSARCIEGETSFTFSSQSVRNWLRLTGAQPDSSVWLWAKGLSNASGAIPLKLVAKVPPSNKVDRVLWLDIFDSLQVLGDSPFSPDISALSATDLNPRQYGAAQGSAALFAKNKGIQTLAVLTNTGLIWDKNKVILPNALANFNEFLAGWDESRGPMPDIIYLADEPYWTGNALRDDPANQTAQVLEIINYIKARFPAPKIAVAIIPGFYLLPELNAELIKLTKKVDILALDPYPTYPADAPAPIAITPLKNASSLGCETPLLARREEIIFACAAKRAMVINPKLKVIYAFQAFLAADDSPENLSNVLQNDLYAHWQSAARSVYDPALRSNVYAVAPFGYFWNPASFKNEGLIPSTKLNYIPQLKRF